MENTTQSRLDEKSCDNQVESHISADPKNEKNISDVVAFSLCSLCAIKLNYLYSEQFHDSFRAQTVQNIVKHLSLPGRASITIGQFTPDDEFTFLSSIKQNHSTGSFKLIEELLLLSIASGSYDARSHYLILEVAESLGVPRELVELHCDSIYNLLLKPQSKESKSSQSEVSSSDGTKETNSKIKRYVVIGLASLGGGAVIGLTGGLAAPIVASALAGVVGSSLAISAAAAGVVGSIFGVAGAGLTASKMNKRIGDLEEFSFHSLNPAFDQTALTITIAISGWISSDTVEGFSSPWKYLRHSKEQYVLCYESKYLLEWSQAMDYLLSLFVSFATQEVLKYTFLSSVIAAIAWPAALISMANIIDNPWDVCVDRSAKAGKHLAHVLKSRQQGKRPASLIGFSLGARVIFYCLQELAQMPDSEGIIGDAVLLGAPVTASEDQWKLLGRVVSGRLINGYSTSDWLLKFLYRTSKAVIRVAGLQPINLKDRRLNNVDLTSLVDGHLDYYKKINQILEFVNVKLMTNYAEHELLAQSTDLTSSLAEPIHLSGPIILDGADKNLSDESSKLPMQQNTCPTEDRETAVVFASNPSSITDLTAISIADKDLSRKALQNIDINPLKTTGDIKSRQVMQQVMSLRIAREQAQSVALRCRRSGSSMGIRVQALRKVSLDGRGLRLTLPAEVTCLSSLVRHRSGSI